MKPLVDSMSDICSVLSCVKGEERIVGIYLEPIILRMETIAHVKFIGQNITRSGIQPVDTTPEVITPKKPPQTPSQNNPTTPTSDP